MEKVHLRGRAAVPVLTTAAMTVSMLPLFLLGALSPVLVREFGLSRPLLGVLVTAGFGVAVVLSLAIGPAVDALGPRRSVIALFATSAVALTVFASAPHYAVLVLAVALGGVPQALANPSTNKLIATSVAAPKRPALLGIKQSGVQLGAFVAGLPWRGWRRAWTGGSRSGSRPRWPCWRPSPVWRSPRTRLRLGVRR